MLMCRLLNDSCIIIHVSIGFCYDLFHSSHGGQKLAGRKGV